MTDRTKAKDGTAAARKRLARERAASGLAVVQRVVVPEMATRILLSRYGFEQDELAEGIERLLAALMADEGIVPHAD